MMYKVQAGKDVFELNPELKAVAEFEPLTERQMKYVILATDYRSPFRKLSPAEKKTRAAAEAGYKWEKDGKRLDMNGRNILQGKNDAVEKAIKKYKILQKDEDYESLLALSKLIGDIRQLNNQSDKTVGELEKAVNMSLKLPALMKAKKELEDIMEIREDAIPDIVSPVDNGEPDSPGTSLLAELNEENPLYDN